MTQINHDDILNQHPWVLERGRHCILSPDSDGFLCGLLMSCLLDWDISGFYDGKVLIIRDGVNVEECVFLDMDVNRPRIRSIGHHMVRYNKRIEHSNFNYVECIQPNLLRNFDGKNDFQRKYPFGTIHLLLGLVQQGGVIQELPREAVWPLLFTDGTWNNLFGYTENCLDWIEYLGITERSHILNYLFCTNSHSFYEIMNGLNDFLRLRDSFNAEGYFFESKYIVGGRNKRTGDKLRITNAKGNIINLHENHNLYSIHNSERERIIGFISSMSDYMNLPYLDSKWTWERFRLTQMQKGDFSVMKLNNTTYGRLMEQNPFSMAMTSGTNIEYTNSVDF